ncbi:AEC family transporter [Radiobacillus kanasensis]|uniref:AEC family transporter n=1 Tax=Radiobacillus kanasensis TaxID=2844358 RepID=UPI001E4FA3B9|nr:AEC family transporter [Radiobacillus kanasensis]UFT99152.1 AEC family transporter [Radiobacillus kanasensis]
MGFISVLIPIFGIFAIGFIGKKVWKIEIKPISTMALYLMSPFLSFRTFYQNDLNMDYAYLGLFLFLLCLSLIVLSIIIGYVAKWDVRNTCGFILSSTFMNNGNYGVPLVLLVFGEKGLHYAVILMILQQLIMCTVGIYIAAKGGKGSVSPLKEVVKVPIIYGAILGIVFQAFDISIGDQLMTAVDMVASATIPTIMIVLGMQLASISLNKIEPVKLSLALMIKLVLAPVIAYGFTLFLPVDELIKDILILMAAMPTAANTTMYALQFNTKPAFVSSSTLTSTLLSIVTLPVILYIIM